MIIVPSVTLRGWCGGLRKLAVGQRRVLTVASKPGDNEAADGDGFTVLRAIERGGRVGRGKRQCKSLRSGTLVKQPPLNCVVLRISSHLSCIFWGPL